MEENVSGRRIQCDRWVVWQWARRNHSKVVSVKMRTVLGLLVILVVTLAVSVALSGCPAKQAPPPDTGGPLNVEPVVAPESDTDTDEATDEDDGAEATDEDDGEEATDEDDGEEATDDDGDEATDEDDGEEAADDADEDATEDDEAEDKATGDDEDVDPHAGHAH